MLLTVVCCVLLAAGIFLAVVWNGERLTPPDAPMARASPGDSRIGRHLAGLRLYLWWAALFTVMGTASGALVTGAGGRLAMRILALTSPGARYRITEAGATIGAITLEGTFSLLVFGALPAAFASAALYLLVEPWLPAGRAAGPVFGVVLLVTVSPFIEPLRADNIDFAIVGPGWLSVLLFSALAILQGALLAAIAGRLSRALPLMSASNLRKTLPPLLPAVLLFPVGALLAPGLLVTFVFPKLLPWFLAIRASRRGVVVGRTLLAIAVVLATPSFISAISSIWSR
ncbi:hypothetical protein [Microbacterium pumilum]|uniref:ABC transporter permease n=1 Tax=Microbacterium pumilum TaxID=344165 RepID=A0ABN2SZH6_9MICO